MAKFVRVTEEQARGMTRAELLERCQAEQRYWIRKRQRGMSAADVAGEWEFYRIMHVYLDLGAALGDARRMLEGQPGGDGYWDTCPVDDAPGTGTPEAGR